MRSDQLAGGPRSDALSGAKMKLENTSSPHGGPVELSLDGAEW